MCFSSACPSQDATSPFDRFIAATCAEFAHCVVSRAVSELTKSCSGSDVAYSPGKLPSDCGLSWTCTIVATEVEALPAQITDLNKASENCAVNALV